MNTGVNTPNRQAVEAMREQKLADKSSALSMAEIGKWAQTNATDTKPLLMYN